MFLHVLCIFTYPLYLTTASSMHTSCPCERRVSCPCDSGRGPCSYNYVLCCPLYLTTASSMHTSCPGSPCEDIFLIASSFSLTYPLHLSTPPALCERRVFCPCDSGRGPCSYNDVLCYPLYLTTASSMHTSCPV